MDIQDRPGLKSQAAQALSAIPNHKMLVLVSFGVTAVLSLATSLITFLLDEQIAGTGGLAGLGMRSILSTLQTLLTIATMAAVPFWSLGYTSTMLKASRRQPVGYGTLLDGFRRFGPALRMILLRDVFYVILAIIGMNIASTIFVMTPWAQPLYDMLNQSDFLTTRVLDEATMNAATRASIPLLLCFGVLFLILVIPVSYRLRLADFRIMDDPKCGAFAALLHSNRLMRYNCVDLFRLDLSFWWYYLGNFIVTLLCYGDTLLPALGITLPFSDNLAFFLFYILGIAAQVALHWYALNHITVTYAKFYDALQSAE